MKIEIYSNLRFRYQDLSIDFHRFNLAVLCLHICSETCEFSYLKKKHLGFFWQVSNLQKTFLFCRWAQQWSNIGDILKPYPGKPNLNVTGEMLSQVRIFIYGKNENLTCPTEPGTILSQELHKAVSRDETSFCTPHISAPFSTLIKYHVR